MKQTIAEALDYALQEHGLDDMGFSTSYAADIVIEALEEAQVIETTEQLNASELSAWGTLIMELHDSNDGCPESNCWVVPVVWEMVNQMGWMCHNQRRDDETPHLPCRVLYRPND